MSLWKDGLKPISDDVLINRMTSHSVKYQYWKVLYLHATDPKLGLEYKVEMDKEAELYAVYLELQYRRGFTGWALEELMKVE